MHDLARLGSALEGREPRRGKGQAMGPDGAFRLGAIQRGKLAPQDLGPHFATDEQELVLPKVAGERQSPDGVAVSDAVDPIENSGHRVRAGGNSGAPPGALYRAMRNPNLIHIP